MTGDPSTTAAAAAQAIAVRDRAPTSAPGVAPRMKLLEQLNLPGVVDVVRGGARDEAQSRHLAARQPRVQVTRPGRGDRRAKIAMHGVEQAQVGPPGGRG